MEPREQTFSASASCTTLECDPSPPTPPPETVSPLPRSSRSKVWSYLNQRVRPTHFAELELLLLSVCIGIQDAVSFPDFHCFASNQTGNTVFLMLAIVLPEMNPEMFVTANIGVALGLFLASAYLTGQIGHIVGQRRRLWLVLCNFIQTCLVFAAAALQYVHHGSSELNGGAKTLVAIGLLAAAAGSQVVLSRALEMTEITTAMATAAWVDLVIDKKLLKGVGNKGRNRRVAFLLALVLGAVIGAFIFKTVGSAPALVVSGAGKMVVTVMFLFNGAEEGTAAEGSKGKEEV